MVCGATRPNVAPAFATVFGHGQPAAFQRGDHAVLTLRVAGQCCESPVRPGAVTPCGTAVLAPQKAVSGGKDGAACEGACDRSRGRCREERMCCRDNQGSRGGTEKGTPGNPACLWYGHFPFSEIGAALAKRPAVSFPEATPETGAESQIGKWDRGGEVAGGSDRPGMTVRWTSCSVTLSTLATAPMPGKTANTSDTQSPAQPVTSSMSSQLSQSVMFPEYTEAISAVIPPKEATCATDPNRKAVSKPIQNRLNRLVTAESFSVRGGVVDASWMQFAVIGDLSLDRQCYCGFQPAVLPVLERDVAAMRLHVGP